MMRSNAGVYLLCAAITRIDFVRSYSCLLNSIMSFMNSGRASSISLISLRCSMTENP